MRILICGYSGSGKSTLADWIGKTHNCPVLYLDTVQFSAGWKERDPAEAEELVKKFLEKEKSWVIDGNYFGRFCWQQRAEMADQILLLKFSPFSCLVRVVKRYICCRGKVRESMAEGCREKLDPEFIWWVLREDRKGKNGAYLDKMEHWYPQKVRTVRNQKELDRLYVKLKQERK